MIDALHVTPYLGRVINSIDLPIKGNRYSGKVRENYDLPDGRRLIVTTDRLSAFDRPVAAIPFKGEVLTQTARYWFDRTASVVPNHVLDYPDPNCIMVQRLDMLPIEIVVRDYLTGHTDTAIWTMYQKGLRHIYGYDFPNGMVIHQKLPRTIVTPTTKGSVHDDPLTATEIVERGLLTRDEWDDVYEKSLSLFEIGRVEAARRGLILVDTKYEFGRDGRGNILLADEIHTPDSSRYWFADTYKALHDAGEWPKSFDKDVIRRWIMDRCNPYRDPLPAIPESVIAETAAVYMDAFERITGDLFLIDPGDLDPVNRIHTNVLQYLDRST